MKEIAKMLEERLVTAQELKDFLSNICCESYNDLQQFNDERQAIEKNFPTYSEQQECKKRFEMARSQIRTSASFPV